MPKQLSEWLDGFVKNGADPNDIDNWPENAGGAGQLYRYYIYGSYNANISQSGNSLNSAIWGFTFTSKVYLETNELGDVFDISDLQNKFNFDMSHNNQFRTNVRPLYCQLSFYNPNKTLVNPSMIELHDNNGIIDGVEFRNCLDMPNATIRDVVVAPSVNAEGTHNWTIINITQYESSI